MPVDFAALTQNLERSERTDFLNLKAANERLLGDIEKLKQRLREEISRTQAGVRLDLNLEKVRLFSRRGEERTLFSLRADWHFARGGEQC